MNPDETKSLITKVLLVLFSSLSTALHLSPDASAMATGASDVADLIVLSYGIYSHRGMVKMPEGTGIIKPAAAFLLALAVALASPPVSAANLAPPALKAVPYSPDNGGMFLGLGSFLGAQKATIGTTDLLATSGSLGGVAGFGRGNGTSWWTVEGGAYWQNLGGSSMCAPGMPCAFGSKFSGTLLIEYGGPITNFLNLLPQLTSLFPGTSPSATASNVYPYAGLEMQFNDVSADLGFQNARAWEIPFGVRVGAKTKLTNGTVMDTWADTTFKGSGFAIGGANVNPGQQYRAGVDFLFGL